MGWAPAVYALYADELILSADSAFVTHGVGTAVVLLSSWLFFCSAIEAVAFAFPSVRASKLQPDAATDDPKLRALAMSVVTRQWISVGSQAVVGAPLLKAVFPMTSSMASSIPASSSLAASTMSSTEYVAFFATWLVTNDAIFTAFHRAFHEIPWLYVLAHKEHHTWKAPFAWMSHAMSDYESGANAVGVMFYPVLHALFLGRTTPLELVWFVMIFAQMVGCIEHSGYDRIHPLVIINPAWFPPWMFSSTRHHDDHHKSFNGNYGGYFAIWDHIMGTTIPPGARSVSSTKRM